MFSAVRVCETKLCYVLWLVYFLNEFALCQMSQIFAYEDCVGLIRKCLINQKKQAFQEKLKFNQC